MVQTFFRPFNYLSHGEPVRGKRYWEAKHPIIHPMRVAKGLVM